MAKVLRAFDYSFDGVKALKANIGDDIDFGDMTSGLLAEGYVAEPEQVVDEPATEPATEPETEPETEPVVSPKRKRK